MTAYIDGKGRLSMPAEAEPQNLVRRGDELLDLATGELVSRPAWEIRSLDDLTFWMGLLHREQVEIEALKARIKNLQGMVAHHEAVKERLEARYTPSARSVVAEQVESGRENRCPLNERGGPVGHRNREAVHVPPRPSQRVPSCGGENANDDWGND